MKTPFIEHLVDGSDRTDFTNDYSTTSADFALLEVDTDYSYYEIDELAFSIVFGSAAPDYALFMATAALTNGITVKMFDGAAALVTDLTDDLPIKTLHDLYARSGGPIALTAHTSHDPDRHSGVCIWRFHEPLILRVDHTLEVGFSDNLSTAENRLFEITARGRKVS